MCGVGVFQGFGQDWGSPRHFWGMCFRAGGLDSKREDRKGKADPGEIRHEEVRQAMGRGEVALHGSVCRLGSLGKVLENQVNTGGLGLTSEARVPGSGWEVVSLLLGPNSQQSRCPACEGIPRDARRLSAPPSWPSSPHPGPPPGNAARPEPAFSCRSQRPPRHEIPHLGKGTIS